MDHFSVRPKRRRKSWTFEKLEERHYFSATPMSAGIVTTLSSNTPEGLQAILNRELAWSLAAYASQQGNANPPRELFALPTDPYFQFQWHLLNVGQEVGSPDWAPIYGKPGEDINVAPAWDLGYTGEGVLVAVVDSGTQTSHPDLSPNIDPALQLNAITGTSNANPDLTDPVNAHGTAVAGLIAAAGNNGIGTTGVAYNAQIVPIRLIDPLFPITDVEIANALRFASDQVDIYNHSWGIATGRLAYTLTPLELFALQDAVRDGRGGLGSIHVFASGNDGSADVYNSSSYSGYTSSRYTIGVGGIDHDGSYNNVDGTVTNYPVAGPSILVAAPTGSFPITISGNPFVGSGIYTTDAMGNQGFNATTLPNGDEIDPTRDHFPDTNYTSRMNGTSAAAPLVSGVIALMLEANPNLSYRDVEEILVRSSRQAGQFEIPTTGGGVDSNLNSWIVNPQPFFTNPDRFPLVPPGPAAPVVDPYTEPELWTPLVYYPAPFVEFNIEGVTGVLLDYDSYKAPRPTLFTNGAGYTVSQGRGPFGELFGYGHGVVDAELAVLLAEQWHTKEQVLPGEESFTTNVVAIAGTTIAGRGEGNGALDGLIVPGGVGSEDDFIDYWDEYTNNDDMEMMDGPFTDYDGPFGDARGGFYHFEVPDANAMVVEQVEVRLDITGDPNGLDFMRIVLVSPNGTVSELNNYFDIEPGTENAARQVPSHPGRIVDPPGEISAADNFIYTFTTNRHWGERYDTQTVIDPVTGNPFLDSFGQAVSQGWELHFENFSGEEYDIDSVEVVWHGRPIDAQSQRVQGAIGIDSGRFGVGAQDGYFNFDRYFQSIVDLDLDFVDLDLDGVRDFDDINGDMIQDADEPFTEPQQIDVNEVLRSADPYQERFAENITVTATRVSDGVEVAHFVTGADGNFYFDLVPDEYIISIDDPLGRTAMTEAGVPAGLLEHYRQEWHITEDWFFTPEVNSSDPFDFRVTTDAGGVPVPYIDAFSQIPSGIKNVNFLLDPGDVPADQVLVSGQVFADINGDGAFNGDDVGAPGFVVYADTNDSGQFENTDTFVTTDALGNYSLPVTTYEIGRFAIGAQGPNNRWEQSSPAEQFYTVVGGPGDIFMDRNFAFEPLGGTSGVAAAGSILGVVFQDLPTEEDPNGDGIRQALEQGIPNLLVFNDADSSGTLSLGETFAFTADNGAYFLPQVGPGDVRVTVRLPEDEPGVPSWAFSSPAAGFRIVNLGSGEVETNELFGLVNLATHDWGDLAGYPTLAAENGPNHLLNPGFQLGASLDGELNGKPSAGADGDNLKAMNDEDGVAIISNGGMLQAGANTLRVTVNGVGGYLNGWIDWNNDGDWDDALEQVFINTDLNPGVHDLAIATPEIIAGGPLAARFRWGSANVSYVGADPNYGEVEDYRLANSLPPMSVISPPGDYDGNFIVDHLDYAVWKAAYGSDDLRADGNGDDRVTAADYSVWRNHLGERAVVNTVAPAVSSASTITSAALLDPAAARAAAYARAIAALDKPPGTQQWGQSPEIAAKLEAAGAVPVTIRVGNGTQTVYYFPGDIAVPAESIAEAPGMVETQLPVVVAADIPTIPSLPALDDSEPIRPVASLRLDLAGLQFRTEFGLQRGTTVLADVPDLSAAALDAGLQLLAEAVLATDVEDVEWTPPMDPQGDEEDEADKCALAAAFDEVRDWRFGI
jgi:subtilisin family serine protease